jgi:excinuclease UvrABC nuclease subunit
MEQWGEVRETARRSFTSENIKRVQEGPGVYKLYAKNAKKPTYIGSGESLRERLMTQKRNRRFHSFEVHHTSTAKQARTKERRMIKRNQPRRNQRLL